VQVFGFDGADRKLPKDFGLSKMYASDKELTEGVGTVCAIFQILF
jgi:hypothetical protein